MPSRKSTTVEFTKNGERLKNRHCVPLGLKGVLSVGLELFDELPADERVSRVRRALELDGDKSAIRAMRSNMLLLSELIADLSNTATDAMTESDEQLASRMCDPAVVDEAIAALRSLTKKRRMRYRQPSKSA